MTIQLDQLSAEDRTYIETEVRKAYPEMETHLEIFTLPSGRELYVWCDGRYGIKEGKAA